MLEDAEGAKGRITKQGVRSGVLPYCLIGTPSTWSTKFCFSQIVEVRTEFRADCHCLLVGTWPGFVLFLLLHLHSRRAAVDSGRVGNTWCCLMEDYHPITG